MIGYTKKNDDFLRCRLSGHRIIFGYYGYVLPTSPICERIKK